MIELLLEMGGEVVDIVDPVETQITLEYVAVSKKYCHQQEFNFSSGSVKKSPDQRGIWK